MIPGEQVFPSDFPQMLQLHEVYRALFGFRVDMNDCDRDRSSATLIWARQASSHTCRFEAANTI